MTKVLHVDSAGICEAPPKPRPGCATLTVGYESVTLDPLLPQEEFDRRRAIWDRLAAKMAEAARAKRSR